jgi:hypothetical protein
MRIAVIGLLCCAVSAFASPITYVFTGVDSGSLNGTSFSSSAFTVTAHADTSNVISCCSGNFSVVTDSVEVSIENVGDVTLTTPTQMWWGDGAALGGLGAYTGNPANPIGLNLINVYDFSESYDLVSNFGPIVPDLGSLEQWTRAGVQSSGGALLFDDTATNTQAVASFQAFVGSSTPEPASLILIGFGLAGLAAIRRRVSAH